MKPSHGSFRPILMGLALSLCGGVLFNLLRIPLPWMLGPLFFVGFAGIHSIRVSDIRGGLRTGQLIVGCGLGLYFTPDVSRQLFDFSGYIILASMLCILSGMLSSRILQRLSGIDATTAFFACLPGGAADMAILSERVGARFDQVTLCHSLRVLLAVSIIPISVTITGASGSSTYEALTSTVVPAGLVLLIVIGSAVGLLFTKLHIPNPFMLGSLSASMALTISGISLSALPPLLTVAAQILIGWSLGARFKPSLRAESRRLIKGILVSASCTMLLSVLVAALIAPLIDESIVTMVLATAPGGLAEMCITAKVLKLGVPLVTSFQVTRLVIIITCSLPLWKLFVRYKNRLVARKFDDNK
ncbi:aminopeptidase [Betaproteobacteria bacterium]|nr:aminopeptidase [Betaproteobacteria bacterium]